MPESANTVGRLLLRHPAWVLAVLFFAYSVVCWGSGWRLGLDNHVYRAAAIAVLRGTPLYGTLPALPSWVGGLPFIYPPIAAVVFVPLAILPGQLGWGLLAALTTLGVGHVLRAAVADERTTATGWPLLLLLGAFCLEPLWLTTGLGQVNVLLMTLVVADVLVAPASRGRGVLVGLAAAIKLTPLVFVPYLLVTRRRADAWRASAAFGVFNVVGLVVLPADTIRFWRSQVLGGLPVSSKSWGGNQSLYGMFLRLSGDADWALGAAVVAGLVCLAAALPVARRLHERGERMAAVLVMGVCGVLVSPISWTHHWVWVIPLFGLLVGRAIRSVDRRWALAGLAVVFGVFTGWTLNVVPLGGNRELAWTPVQTLLGNAYVLTALLAAPFVCWWAFRGNADVRESPATADDQDASLA